MLLNESIRTFVQTDGVPKLPSHYRIVARIYVNLIGFSRKYCSAGILQSQDGFEQFIRGFNKTYPLFEIVDAGNEKECSDSKIRGKHGHGRLATPPTHCSQKSSKWMWAMLIAGMCSLAALVTPVTSVS